MMYPRLFLARQLLREDGVIFVSIDDHEVHNLRMMMNEVFGEENFLATFVRKRRMTTGMRGEPVSPDHEFVITYARLRPTVLLFGTAKTDLEYPFEDQKGRYRSTDLTVGMTKQMRPKQFYAITNPRTKKKYSPPEDRVWRFQPSTMREHIVADNIIWPDDYPERRLSRPRFKTRRPTDESAPVVVPVSTWIDTDEIESPAAAPDRLILDGGLNQEGTKELKDLFGSQVYDYPKPVSLLRALISLATTRDDIVMDFFAGSCTTAHAVLDLNYEDGGCRSFIVAQLPEPTPEKSAARSEGFRNIAEIGKSGYVGLFKI